MRTTTLGFLTVLGLATSCLHTNKASPPVTEYQNGSWFDGTQFVPRTMWVVGDHFETQRPNHVDRIVDVGGGFVVPPYAEGHNHWLEPSLVDTYINAYLHDGIFYVQDLLTAPAFHEQIRSRVNIPTSVDYVAAHLGFTGPRGHPMELVDQLVQLGVLPAAWHDKLGDGDVLLSVASADDVARTWPRVVTSNPDFVKVFLVHSDEYAQRRDDDTLTPAARGIDPALVPDIVARAHAAHLRVFAHIENAYDFHVAVTAGVDHVAHLPFVNADDLESYRIADSDIAGLGAHRGSVATTLNWASDATSPDDPQLEVARDNITRLRAAGCTVIIGTDLFRTTARDEVDRLASLHVMTNLELLRSWSIETPRAIFPTRDIARLDDGAEASFLVLKGNPLDDFANAHEISMWVKQGIVLTPPKTDSPSL